MQLSPRHAGIILCGLVTAYLHISLFSDFGYLDWVVLNGVGTLALLGAYFLPIPFLQQRHRLVYGVLCGYIVLTILLWLIFGDKTFQYATTAATGYYAKTAELLMLAFLLADLSSTRAGTAGRRS